MRTADRISRVPPYLFASLDRKVAEARSRGIDVISFAVGDPDMPTPVHIVEAAKKAIEDSANHRYPSYYGMAEFREAVARFYKRRFDVTLDPETQVLALIGSKEGIAHLATAFVDPGDTVVVPDPGYPVYATSTILAGGNVTPLPLTDKNGFLPDGGAAGAAVKGAKVLWANHPSNPTASVCDLPVLQEMIDACQKEDCLLAHDAAYVEMTYDGYVAPSALEAKGALQNCIEFGSLSKTFNMTGWRVGWAAGAATAVEALGRVKTNIDSGVFNAVQIASIAAIDGGDDDLLRMRDVYKRRRDSLVSALRSGGLDVATPKGAIYLWTPIPEGETSESFTEFLLEKAQVLVAPGTGYGQNGEGYVRFSLTVPDDRLVEGAERVQKALASR